MLYVWDIELQKHYADDIKGQWDSDFTSVYCVVAPDYDSALATAKTLAMSETFHYEDTDTDTPVDDVRLISIKQGIYIDAVAAVKAA